MALYALTMNDSSLSVFFPCPLLLLFRRIEPLDYCGTFIARTHLAHTFAHTTRSTLVRLVCGYRLHQVRTVALAVALKSLISSFSCKYSINMLNIFHKCIARYCEDWVAGAADVGGEGICPSAFPTA